MSNVKGNVYDSNNKFVTTFTTNSSGIGRFLFYPNINQKYIVRVNHLNKAFEFKINNIKSKGISIRVNNNRRNLAIEFNTNERTLNDIKGKLFKMTIHNGKDVKGIIVTFKEKSLVKIVEREELFPGINVVTLFDENNRPVLERILFNHIGINHITSGTAQNTRLKDSTRISLPFKQFSNLSMESSNISISVLPEETTSYQRHHNIISHTYLQPYIKGSVENAQYYFTNVDSKKKYDLDNLLITQGWSSYDWDNIFNNKVTNRFVFEDGIILKANNNSSRQRDFILYPLKSNEDEVTLKLPEDQNSFVVHRLYPEADEKLGIGALNKKGKVKRPNIYAQFFPSKIPDYDNPYDVLRINQSTIIKTLPKSQFTLFDVKDTKVLDEVTIKASSKSDKIRKAEADAFSRIDVFDDVKRRMNLTFKNYINAYFPSFIAEENIGTLTIRKRVPTSLRVPVQSPIVYLDDVYMPSLVYFYGFDMSVVDYVTVNKSGAGEGFLGANGVIRIYTSLDFIEKSHLNPFEQFEFPITFSENKKFYVPKYDVYNDDFFKEYGVIDWIPNSTIDNRGNLNFTVYNPTNNNVKLFIEGVTDNGGFISEVKVLNMNDSQ